MNSPVVAFGKIVKHNKQHEFHFIGDEVVKHINKLHMREKNCLSKRDK